MYLYTPCAPVYFIHSHNIRIRRFLSNSQISYLPRDPCVAFDEDRERNREIRRER